MMFFLKEDDEEAVFAGCLGLEKDGIKFENTLTLREMIYLEGVLSSLRAKHDAWE
jgi:hypothetical protein